MLYLKNFEFLTEETEQRMLALERRLCFDQFYPMGIFPAKGMKRIEFDDVTIFYGGNGSGKSTALNIIAAKLKLLREIPFKPSEFFDWYVDGASRYDHLHEKNIHVDGVNYNLEDEDDWKSVPPESRILTSEDVFDKTLTIRGRNREIDRQRALVSKKWWAYNVKGEHINYTAMEGPEHDAWKSQHSMAGKCMSSVIKKEVGFNIKTGSNGENAFEFFMEKIQGNALYLLDEPENSMSANWQMKLTTYIEGMARFEGCQFVIATHSPFLLGIKGAKIYDLDKVGVPVRKWTELENVREYFDFFRSRACEFEEKGRSKGRNEDKED